MLAKFNHAARLCLVAVLVVALSGCQSEPARFVQNMAYKHKQERANMGGDECAPTELSREVTQDVANILGALFGTPDAPKLPAMEGVELDKLLDQSSLDLAAGAVKSDQRGEQHGLYREHCVHCHGITGDGNGPTAAFLNPYPRDYRMGLYKFKSTKKGEKPTHEDLRRIVNSGVPGTAMPSFALLPEREVDALIDYVKYLSIRGEVERALFTAATELEDPYDPLKQKYLDLSELHAQLSAAGANPALANVAGQLKQAYNKLYAIRSCTKRYEPPKELEKVDDIAGKTNELVTEAEKLVKDLEAYQPPRLYVTGPNADSAKLKEQLQPFVDMTKELVERWLAAQSLPVPAPPHPLDPTDKDAIARGRAIFYGPIANCFSCHGESGLGDGQRDFYDDWSGEWVEKGKPEATAEYVKLNALPPRNLIPRNLRLGVYRGGRRPVDLYWRLTNGIDGAQMPAVPLLAESDPPGTKKLSQQELWDLIAYVRSLPYEAISQPARVEDQMLKEVQ